ncbi:hypothetical protein ACJX0J_005595, partial [Zea mays]
WILKAELLDDFFYDIDSGFCNGTARGHQCHHVMASISGVHQLLYKETFAATLISWQADLKLITPLMLEGIKKRE